MIAQSNHQIAKKNEENSAVILKIAQDRFKLGNIAENELLQLELTLLNANQAVAQARLDLETSVLTLKIYVGIKEDAPLAVIIPDEIPDTYIDEELAISEAKKNRPEIVGFERQRLEANRDLSKAKRSRFSGTLSATYGYSNASTQILNVYQNAVNQQTVLLSFSVPVLDWGRTNARIQTALANQKLVESTVEQNELNFLQEIYTQVKKYKMLIDQIKLTRKAADIAQRRYDISQSRYLVGKVSITDLNIAMNEKDLAMRNYLESLRDYWISYYELRVLTLYDFQNNTLLDN